MTDTIEISKDEYFKLRVASETLSRLEGGGVDNWDWYGESIYGDSNEEDFDEWEENLHKEIFGN